jgi:hypothetical protein
MLAGLLKADGHKAGRLHVATLMKRMGIAAIYRRPNTSKPAPGHKIFPYLLRKLPVTRPNQVWAMDITYIPMARGFVYLAAVMDWFNNRRLLKLIGNIPPAEAEELFCARVKEVAPGGVTQTQQPPAIRDSSPPSKNARGRHQYQFLLG